MLFHEEGTELPEKERIHELAARHYDPLSIEQLNHEDARELKNWLTQNHHSILVTGAFGRSEVSALFRKSYVTDIIRAHKVPVFVAHQ
jgi:Cft2 family RNA processing exonuclease